MNAPYYQDVAQGPQAQAYWVKTADGVRLRAAIWLGPAAPKGTVFMFPGRTEYIEKYGLTAADFDARGYAMLAIDWRGQGLADRALADPMAGHVVDFAEYQRDIDAALKLARAQNLPQPWYLLSHSMGGCIALRCLLGDHPFKAAAFSAPMWGILMAAWMRPAAIALTAAAKWFSFDHSFAPGTKPRTYVLDQGFAGNTLTTDEPMWAYMRAQAQAHPELSLGGPSMGWLKAALDECRALSARPSPDFPVMTGLGTAEKIVDVAPIHARMALWPRGRLAIYPGAEHEILMEQPAARNRFADEAAALFDLHR